MARKDDMLGVSGAETVIGAGVELTGNLTSDNDILIDGTMTGKIMTLGNVTLGANAVVTADIQARSITIAGQLTGNIKSTDETNIASTGRLEGDIQTGMITIGSGAIIKGGVKTTQAEALASEHDREPDIDN